MNITTYTKEALYIAINVSNIIYTQITNNLKVKKISILIGYYKSHGVGIKVTKRVGIRKSYFFYNLDIFVNTYSN